LPKLRNVMAGKRGESAIRDTEKIDVEKKARREVERELGRGRKKGGIGQEKNKKITGRTGRKGGTGAPKGMEKANRTSSIIKVRENLEKARKALFIRDGRGETRAERANCVTVGGRRINQTRVVLTVKAEKAEN